MYMHIIYINIYIYIIINGLLFVCFPKMVAEAIKGFWEAIQGILKAIYKPWMLLAQLEDSGRNFELC